MTSLCANDRFFPGIRASDEIPFGDDGIGPSVSDIVAEDTGPKPMLRRVPFVGDGGVERFTIVRRVSDERTGAKLNLISDNSSSPEAFSSKFKNTD